jgi:hypothetical protein
LLIFINYNNLKKNKKDRNMIKIMKGALITLALIGFTGCVSTSDIDIESVKSEKANLKGYKTYQFIEGSGFAKDTSKKTLTQNESVSAEIEALINEELAKKGKVAVSKDPDFFVAYLGGTDRAAVTVKLNKDGKEVVEKTPEAAMILMLVDADSGDIIWMSSGEGDAKSNSKEDQSKRLKYTVKKMLQGI